LSARSANVIHKGRHKAFREAKETKHMNTTVWKAYKTEKAAIKFRNQLNNYGHNATVEFHYGLYYVVSA
jgi:hypothetical protein